MKDLFTYISIILFAIAPGIVLEAETPVETVPFMEGVAAQRAEIEPFVRLTEAPEATPEPTPEPEPVIEYIYLGEFETTGYCACSICCGQWADGITATGVTATAKHTIAVDPSVIPYGTVVEIGGVWYVAEDCGGAVRGNIIDIFYDSHAEASAHGRQKASVYKVVG